ncbi:hypothetical protein FX016_24025 [Cupriavidus gilardii]|nr:hypothetical protein FX016_24025 [Cupriavidus gilardii]
MPFVSFVPAQRPIDIPPPMPQAKSPDLRFSMSPEDAANALLMNLLLANLNANAFAPRRSAPLQINAIVLVDRAGRLSAAIVVLWPARNPEPEPTHRDDRQCERAKQQHHRPEPAYSAPPRQRPEPAHSAPPRHRPEPAYSAPPQGPEPTYGAPPPPRPEPTYSAPPQGPEPTYGAPPPPRPEPTYSAPPPHGPESTHSAPPPQEPAASANPYAPDGWSYDRLPHEILGLNAGETDLAKIGKAFRAASLKAHPDKGGSQEAMQAVGAAREFMQAQAEQATAGSAAH